MKFEGTQVNIPIKGIMRAGTDNLCADGAMNEVIGMEYKDGSWLPYKENEEEWEVKEKVDNVWTNVTNIKDVYTHKVSNYSEHFLFLLSDKRLLYETNRDSLPPKTIFTDVLENSVKEVSFIGNMVCIATNSGLIYYLWKDDEYVKQEVIYPTVNIRTSLGFLNNEGEKLLGVEYDNIQGVRTDHTEIPQTNYRSVVIGDLLAVKKKVTEKGGLSGYCFAVVAYRLKNGDFICPNPPVLLGRPKAAYGSKQDGFREYCLSTQSEYFGIGSSGTQRKLYSEYEVGHSYPGTTTINHDTYFFYPTGDPTVRNTEWDYAHTKTKEIKYYMSAIGELSSSPAVHTFGWEPAPSTLGFVGYGRALVPDLHLTRISVDYGDTHNVQVQHYAYAAGNGVQLKIQNAIEENNIIESICLFLTEEVSSFRDFAEVDRFSDIFSGSGLYANGYNSADGYANKVATYIPERKKESTIIKELSELNSFYLVEEIRLSDYAQYSSWKDIDLSGKLGDNLVVREQLPITAFDNTETTPTHVESYNYRLHAFDYKQEPYKGYDREKYQHNGGLGQYPVTYINAPGDMGNYWKWEAKIEIDDIDGSRTVVVRDDSTSYVRNIVNTLTPFIMYPSLYAKSITFRVYKIPNGGGGPYYVYAKTLDFKRSDSLGFSYYAEPELKPIVYTDNPTQKTGEFHYEFEEDNVEVAYHNGLKVSDVAYPSVFPQAYTYRIGNETIIGLARLTTPVSQDNFGNNQLIVFCTDGIYAMSVDATGKGAYTNIQPRVSPEVCLNPNSICEIGGAVFFAGDKGLMVLTGNNNVEMFAPQLNGVPRFLPAAEQSKEAHGIYRKMIDDEQILSKEGDNFADSISNSDFIDFIKDNGTRLIYISIKNKLLAYNKDYDYAYFIDIPTRNTTKIAMSAMCDDGDIIGRTIWEEGEREEGEREEGDKSYTVHTFGYLSEEDDDIPCLILSRPIKVQQDDKCSYRVVLTGYFEGVENNWADLVVLGSLDADNWRVIGVKEKKLVGGFHNLGCLTERGSWKYIMFIFAGKLTNESHIDLIDITVDGRYNNKKR